MFQSQIDCPIEIEKEETTSSLIEKTLVLFRSVLPPCWTVIADRDAFHLLQLSRSKDPAIQRNVYVTYSGSFRITVHRKELSRGFTEVLMQSWPQGLRLTSQSHKSFVDHVLSVVLKVRSYEICAGADNLQFEDSWSMEKQGVIDCNPYDEARYTKTFRSDNCCLLVPIRKWKCQECLRLTDKLRDKVKSHSDSEAHPNTRNDYLDRRQTTEKLGRLGRTVKNQRRKIDSGEEGSGTT